MTDELQDDGPSIRDELAAALTADAQTQAAPAIDTTQSVPVPETDAAKDARIRDEQGRFAPKPAELSNSQPETPLAGAEPVAQPQTIMPPPSWSAAAKAKFATLEPEIREEILKREGDIERGKAQWDQKAERLNRLDAVLSPRAERFRLAGVDEVTAVQQLLSAHDFLERDPTNALAYLARQYGVDLRTFAQHMPDGQAPQQGQLPPELQGLAQDVQSLKSAWTQQQTAAEQHVRASYLDQVQAFASDPANLYFENVRGHMGKLIASGAASDLKDAYDKATWADPTVRPLLLKAQEDARQAEARAAASAKVQQARQAAGSVTGSPSHGASPDGASPAPSLRQELERNFQMSAA